LKDLDIDKSKGLDDSLKSLYQRYTHARKSKKPGILATFADLLIGRQ